jgi:uncharacterized protein YraI
MRLGFKKYIRNIFSLFFLLTACSPAATSTAANVEPATQTTIATSTFPPSTVTFPPPTETVTFTPFPPTETSTATSIPFVDSLKATVTADLLSCRYGPGANYLYLIAFNKTTPLRLIGRAEGNEWVLVEFGRQDCWVNSQFVELKDGDLKTLHSVYPDGFKIPVSPYYGPTTVLSAIRKEDKIIVDWREVIVSPGKYEDENMFPYIVEVWRCENGAILFETLGSRIPLISFVDQVGCDMPSHGRVYVQEKHGYAGPAEIPWPVR